MIPKDTAAEACARQIADLRALGPEARLRLAVAASDEVRELGPGSATGIPSGASPQWITRSKHC